MSKTLCRHDLSAPQLAALGFADKLLDRAELPDHDMEVDFRVHVAGRLSWGTRPRPSLRGGDPVTILAHVIEMLPVALQGLLVEDLTRAICLDQLEPSGRAVRIAQACVDLTKKTSHPAAPLRGMVDFHLEE